MSSIFSLMTRPDISFQGNGYRNVFSLLALGSHYPSLQTSKAHALGSVLPTFHELVYGPERNVRVRAKILRSSQPSHNNNSWAYGSYRKRGRRILESISNQVSQGWDAGKVGLDVPASSEQQKGVSRPLWWSEGERGRLEGWGTSPMGCCDSDLQPTPHSVEMPAGIGGAMRLLPRQSQELQGHRRRWWIHEQSTRRSQKLT